MKEKLLLFASLFIVTFVLTSLFLLTARAQYNYGPYNYSSSTPTNGSTNNGMNGTSSGTNVVTPGTSTGTSNGTGTTNGTAPGLPNTGGGGAALGN